MKKTFKRFMAFAMVAALTASPMSAITADATTVATDPSANASGNSPAEGKAEASGELEGYVDTDVFKVVLPTSAEGVFDFTLDPQQLINATSGNAYGGTASAEFEDDATVFFNTTSGNAAKKKYESTSKYVQVYNKGTVDCNVSVKAELSNTTGITMVSSEAAVSGDTNPNLYLAFTASGDASGDAKGAGNEKVLTSTGAELSAVLKAVSGNFYEFNVASANAADPKDKYSYDLKEEFVSADASIAGVQDYSFALTGACNSEADWSKVTVAPKVVVTWTLKDAESGSAATETEVDWSSTGQYFYLSVPGVSSLDMTKLSNVRVVQDSVDEAVTSYNKSTSGSYITITWTAIKTNILWPASNPGKTITFNFTYDGVDYTATYEAE